MNTQEFRGCCSQWLFLKTVDTNILRLLRNDLRSFCIRTAGSILKPEKSRILCDYIPSMANSWGKVLGNLEEAKEQCNFENYSISQMTLEQVFLTFANLQNIKVDCKEKMVSPTSNLANLVTSPDSWAEEQTSRMILVKLQDGESPGRCSISG